MQGEDGTSRGQPDPPPQPSSEAPTGAMLAWLEGSAWRLRLLESDPSFDHEVVAREAGQWEQRLHSLVRDGLPDYTTEVIEALGCAGVSAGYQWVDSAKPGAQVALARMLGGQAAGGSRAVLEWSPEGWALRGDGLRFMPGETAFPLAADVAEWVVRTLHDPPPSQEREITARTRWIHDVLASPD